MNHIYRVIWNKNTSCWQAVTETAKGQTKSSKGQKARTVLNLMFNVSALNGLLMAAAIAAPTGGVVSAGTASISTSGATTTINQTTAKAAIDWSSFSTASTETVNFVQPSSSSITLNRVTGTSASTLNGKLNANGQVFIINPNGILFGSTSQVNVGGFVASTLNHSNTDFLNGNFNFANSSNNKTVENRGKITVPTGGTVALIAPSIKQTGTITTPEGSTLLAAGSDVTLTLDNGSLVSYTINQGKAQALINSGGLIKADGGKVILTAKGIDELSQAVVNQTGVIEAQTVNTKRGVIELGSDMTSGTVNVNGKLDASAPVSGNGGLIKTAASTVNAGSGAIVTTRRVSQTSLPPTTSGWEVTANNVDVDLFSGINSTILGTALDNGNVTLKAVGTAEEQGNININDATSWSGNTALTLNAAKDINFNNDLSLSGDKAKLAMSFGSGHDYNLNNGAKINITGILPTLMINGTVYTVVNELGEEGDASVITLQGMKNNLTGNYALGGDIDASDTVNWNEGKGFDPIGDGSSLNLIGSNMPDLSGIAFQGEFHGLGHSIDSLVINRVGTNFIGLFSLSQNAKINNIGLTNTTIVGQDFVGGLLGINVANSGVSKIQNSFVQGDVTGVNYIGGMIGLNLGQASGEVQVIDSFTSGSVSGGLATGGFIGANVAVNGLSNIINNHSDAHVSNNNLDPTYRALGGFGGLIGQNSAGPAAIITVNSSYATGTVSGDNYVGGLIGQNGSVGADSNNIISSSYATGKVTSHGNSIHIGGLIGDNASIDGGQSHIVFSYSTNESVDGESMVGGLIGSAHVFGDSSLEVKNSYSTSQIDGHHGALNLDSSDSSMGGLIGEIYSDGGQLEISDNYATGNVNGDYALGGLIGNVMGANDNINLARNYAAGNILGVGSVGGLIGTVESRNGNITSIYDSYAIGRVTGESYLGGLIGNMQRGGMVTVNNTYSSGMVLGNSSQYSLLTQGGLIGNIEPISTVTQNSSINITNSYWNTETSGQAASAGGTGKTTAEMQQIATFSGWDIADISDPLSTSVWVIDENNDSPKLRSTF